MALIAADADFAKWGDNCGGGYGLYPGDLEEDVPEGRVLAIAHRYGLLKDLEHDRSVHVSHGHFAQDRIPEHWRKKASETRELTVRISLVSDQLACSKWQENPSAWRTLPKRGS